MRIAFLGTPDFASGVLEALAEAGHDIACVYSQPPRPKGRGQTLQPSPVHARALALGLPVRTPASMKAAEEIAAFQALDLEAAVVVAYGQILLKTVLDAPRLGCFNLHASLLPRWRGAAPIQRAIMAGDLETGVEVMRMSEGLDEGDVLLSARTAIAPDDTAATLHDKLAALGAPLMVRALDLLARGEAVFTPQTGETTYAKKIKPAEARLDFAKSAAEVDRQIRGLSPFPGAWFEASGPQGRVRVKALLSRVEDGAGEPGQLLDADLCIACGDGAVRLLKVQREGKAAQSAGDFLNGYGRWLGDRVF